MNPRVTVSEIHVEILLQACPFSRQQNKGLSGRQVIPKETNQQTDSKKPNEGEALECSGYVETKS